MGLLCCGLLNWLTLPRRRWAVGVRQMVLTFSRLGKEIVSRPARQRCRLQTLPMASRAMSSQV